MVSILEQMSNPTMDDLLVERMLLVYSEEAKINPEETIYLITWSPDPAELPDSDVHYQNQYNVDLLAGFLKTCECGLFCMELNQLGNVHYHGWYQVNDDMNVERSAIIKTMKRFALRGVKITKCLSYKFNCYMKKSNGLYYYKEDIGSYLSVVDAVISKDSKCAVDWNSMTCNAFFTQDTKMKFVADRISHRKYYEDFYRDSN